MSEKNLLIPQIPITAIKETAAVAQIFSPENTQTIDGVFKVARKTFVEREAFLALFLVISCKSTSLLADSGLDFGGRRLAREIREGAKAAERRDCAEDSAGEERSFAGYKGAETQAAGGDSKSAMAAAATAAAEESRQASSQEGPARTGCVERSSGRASRAPRSSLRIRRYPPQASQRTQSLSRRTRNSRRSR